MNSRRAIPMRPLLLGAVAALGGCFATQACRCQDAQPAARSVDVKLTAEQQQASNIDRIRFNLKTPEDYAKEAYLSIDDDNVLAEFQTLRQAIEAELATPDSVSTAVTHAADVTSAPPPATSL